MKTEKLVKVAIGQGDEWHYYLEKTYTWNEGSQIEIKKSEIDWVNFVFLQFEDVQDFLRKKLEKASSNNSVVK